MSLKAVVFDLGDTLILTDRWDYDKCLRKLLESLQRDNIGHDVSYDDFRRVYFKVRDQMYSELEKTLREAHFLTRVSRTLAELGYNISVNSPVVKRAAEAFVEAFVEDMRMENYVPQLLAELKKKYRLGVVTNFAYAPGVRKALQRFDLTTFFDAVAISAEAGFRKPHPRIFKEALKKLSVRATEAVFVGDSLKADINGAKNLGFKTVLVENVGVRKNPYAIGNELDPYPVEPDAKIPTLRDLTQALNALF